MTWFLLPFFLWQHLGFFLSVLLFRLNRIFLFMWSSVFFVLKKFWWNLNSSLCWFYWTRSCWAIFASFICPWSWINSWTFFWAVVLIHKLNCNSIIKNLVYILFTGQLKNWGVCIEYRLRERERGGPLKNLYTCIYMYMHTCMQVFMCSWGHKFPLADWSNKQRVMLCCSSQLAFLPNAGLHPDMMLWSVYFWNDV